MAQPSSEMPRGKPPLACNMLPWKRRRKARVFLEKSLPLDGRKAHLSRLAGGLGFEPRLTESESVVLPLDDPPINLGRGRMYSLRNVSGQVGSATPGEPGIGRGSIEQWRTLVDVIRTCAELSVLIISLFDKFKWLPPNLLL